MRTARSGAANRRLGNKPLDYEYLYQQVALPPYFPLVAWRGGVPVCKDDRQVGHATTGAWSPALKKYIALATLEKKFVPDRAPSSILK